MDQLSTQPAPIVSVLPVHPPRLILITAFVVTTLLSFLAGYFFPKFNNPSPQSSVVLTKSNPPVPTVSSTLTVNLPIAASSSSVKSLWVVYLLTGVVDSIASVTKDDKSGQEIQMSSPTGPLVSQKFFASDQTTNVVLLDSKGKETKYQLSMLKKGDPIQLNYQLDIKKPTEVQVTKIAVLK